MARPRVGFDPGIEQAVNTVSKTLNSFMEKGIGGGKPVNPYIKPQQQKSVDPFRQAALSYSQDGLNPFQKKASYSGVNPFQRGSLGGRSVNPFLGYQGAGQGAFGNMFKPATRGLPGQAATDGSRPLGTGTGDASRAVRVAGVNQHKALLEKVAAESGVPWQVLAATMALETGGENVGANADGAMGLMQVVPTYWQDTANRYGGDLMNPYTNVRTAAEIMKQNYDTYGSWEKAAAAYFGGGGAFNSDGSYSLAQDSNGTTISDYVNIWSNNLAYFGYGQPSEGDVAGGGSAASAAAEFASRKAASAIGTPYIFGGESYEEGGFDCSGLVQWAYEGRLPARTADQQYHSTQRIPKAALQKGDLMFYDWDADGVVDHVGMYWGNGQMLHAPKENDIVKIVDVNNEFWNQYSVGYGRVG